LSGKDLGGGLKEKPQKTHVDVSKKVFFFSLRFEVQDVNFLLITELAEICSVN